LIEEGDPVEKEGCEKYSLHERFPRYAEIWGRYVWRRRDPEDSSRFRQGFPCELEYLFNHHYGVWFHLILAYRQIDALRQSNPLVDIGDPFFHLVTAAELVERAFVIAEEFESRLRGTTIIDELSEEIQQKDRPFFPASHLEHLHEWLKEKEGMPELFDKSVKQERLRNKFKTVSQKIRHHRNVLAHSLPPLRVVNKDGKVCIPREGFLSEYDHALWSSRRSDYSPERYEIADVEIGNLADRLVRYTNDLWEKLSTTITEIVSSEHYKDEFPSEKIRLDSETYHCGIEANPGEESQIIIFTRQSPKSDENTGYSGGTIPWFPTKPSAYNDG
jgi:hypothetical protein